MENITHSLVGAALAELALPTSARPAQRRLFFAAGIVAANLPDADLLYTRITPAPLGYLLHHRGHTHTLVGCAVLGIAAWLLLWLIPPIRRAVAEAPSPLWWMVAAALSSHLLLDSWNSYGIHPFWPLDNRWYYGDAIFILEPWLWTLLGAAVAMNSSTRARRIVLVAGLIVLPVALVWFRMIPLGALLALASIGATFGWATRGAARRKRSAAALATTAAFVAIMFGLSRVSRGLSLASLGPSQQGAIVDVVLNPNPGVPLCWTAIAIGKNEARREYSFRRGTLALFDGWLPLSLCGPRPPATPATGVSRTRVTWSDPVNQSLTRLRDLSRDDCWVRAWLQFGRAPILGDQDIADFRFGDRGRSNFSAMPLLPLEAGKICPPNLTSWGMPRADLLR